MCQGLVTETPVSHVLRTRWGQLGASRPQGHSHVPEARCRLGRQVLWGLAQRLSWAPSPMGPRHGGGGRCHPFPALHSPAGQAQGRQQSVLGHTGSRPGCGDAPSDQSRSQEPPSSWDLGTGSWKGHGADPAVRSWAAHGGA